MFFMFFIVLFRRCEALLSDRKRVTKQQEQTHENDQKKIKRIKERTSLYTKVVAVKHLFSHVSSLQLVRFYFFSLKHARVCVCVCVRVSI
jgi:hypothetical protein